jgi:hypothetical protein
MTHIYHQTSTLIFDQHASMSRWVRWYFYRKIVMLSSSCDSKLSWTDTSSCYRHANTMLSSSCELDRHMGHVGNNVSDAHPRRIGNGLNDASCMLIIMLSSLLGLPTPAWVSLEDAIFVNGLAQSGVGKHRKCSPHGSHSIQHLVIWRHIVIDSSCYRRIYHLVVWRHRHAIIF